MSGGGAIYPSLAGRAVFVTGGASGIGAAMVRAFAAQGARVGFVDIDAEAAKALAEALPGVRWWQADLRDVDALKAVLVKAGAVDVLVNNAARDDRHGWEEVTREYWDDALAVNLRHQFFATQAVAAGMRGRGGGSVILTGSVSWMRGMPGMVGYTTSKAAIGGLTRTLARELGPAGIRVNCIVPGAIRTERQARLWRTPEKDAEFLERQAIPVVLDEWDVARLALWLGSDESRGCTGHDWYVDAGLALG